MELIYTPKSEIDTRIQRVQEAMIDNRVSGLMITHHTNLFYFSGTSQNGLLFIPCEGEPVLMIKKSYERAKKESPLTNIIALPQVKKAAEIIADGGYHDFSSIGFELDIIPVNTYRYYQNIFPNFTITDGSLLIKKLRLLKSDHEIGLLKHSCNIADEAFKTVPSIIDIGMAEVELAGKFEALLRKGGMSGSTKMRTFNQDFLFGNIVSGNSGCIPTYFDGPVGGQGLTPANNPHGASWKKIKQNESIYIDYACVSNGYTSDTTRIFSIGPLSDDLVKAHLVALEIQETLVQHLTIGVSCESLYTKACEIAQRYQLLENFMGYKNDKVRFIGHGVGLELDEIPIFAPKIDMPLEAGMAFALEPKFVFPHGAVGIENTFALTTQGLQKLNTAVEEIVVL